MQSIPDKISNSSIVKVNSILQPSFSIDEKFHRQGEMETRYFFRQETGFNKEENLFNITLTCYFTYLDSVDILATTTVQNIFVIQNLSNYFKDDSQQMALPGEILAMCLGMAVSHTRALFSKSLQGTFYQNLIIPPINVIELANDFFYRTQLISENKTDEQIANE